MLIVGEGLSAVHGAQRQARRLVREEGTARSHGELQPQHRAARLLNNLLPCLSLPTYFVLS